MVNYLDNSSELPIVRATSEENHPANFHQFPPRGVDFNVSHFDGDNAQLLMSV